MMKTHSAVSINKATRPRVRALIDKAEPLRLQVHTVADCRIIDAGIDAPGGLEAGRHIAEICMGGLGTVTFRASTDYESWSWYVDVHSADPVMACLASQYAGWSLSHGEGEGAFYGLGSGPARAIGSKEPLFDEIGYRDQADETCLVLEVGAIPPAEIAREVAEQCQVKPENLTLILTPTASLAGSVQVVARVLETALHKAHELHFPLEKIVDGFGSAPVCPPAPDFLTAMSRTNDAILFAGQVHLFVDAENDEAKTLANALPSSTSKDYGRPFAEVFKAVDHDFYRVDPMLFSPARVTVSSIKTGRSFHAGELSLSLLNQSFTTLFT